MKRKDEYGMIVFFLFVLVLTIFSIRMLEAKALFAPMRDVLQTPKEAGLDYESVTLIAADGVRLSGWFIPSGSCQHVLYFLHGNAGNISHRLASIRLFHELGWNVFIIDYRGYGTSTGWPSEAGLYKDARAGYDYLVKIRHFAAENIVVEGESLGAAVAVELASHVPVRGLILMGAFTSVADLGKALYPAIPSFLIASKFDSLSHVGVLTCPILFIHSRQDEIVPFEMGRRLYEAYNGDKEFVATTGGHNDHFLIHETLLKDALGLYLAKVVT